MASAPISHDGVMLHFPMLLQGCPCPPSDIVLYGHRQWFQLKQRWQRIQRQGKACGSNNSITPRQKSSQSFLAAAAGVAHELGGDKRLPARVQNRKKKRAEGKKTKWKIRKNTTGDYKTKWVAVCISGNLLFPKAAHQGAGSEAHGARPQASGSPLGPGVHLSTPQQDRPGLCHRRAHGSLQKRAPGSTGRCARPLCLLCDTAFLKSCKTNSLAAPALPKIP